MKSKIEHSIYISFVLICTIFSLAWVGYTLINSNPEDFRVFYESARISLRGETIYRTYGPIELPYWYFPWLAWFYIPLAIFPKDIAYIIYIGVSLIFAIICINFLAGKFNPKIIIFDKLFIFSMSLPLCWLLFRVGQMDFILLAATVLIIHFIDLEKPSAAGFLVPILLFKPHLFIVFLPYAAFKGKREFVISAVIVTLVLIIFSFIIIPDWPVQMLRLLTQSGQRTDNNWNFTTLPNMLGLQENWSGTANLPITFVLILIALLVVWKFRSLQTLPLLSLALAGSLFCAPRAYAYNLPILLPAMMWLSAKWSKLFLILFWLVAGILPFFFRYSTGTYSLTFLVFIFSIYKVFNLERQEALS